MSNAHRAVPAAHLADLTISQHQLQALGQRIGLLDQRMERVELQLGRAVGEATAAREAAERIEVALRSLLERLALP